MWWSFLFMLLRSSIPLPFSVIQSFDGSGEVWLQLKKNAYILYRSIWALQLISSRVFNVKNFLAKRIWINHYHVTPLWYSLQKQHRVFNVPRWKLHYLRLWHADIRQQHEIRTLRYTGTGMVPGVQLGIQRATNRRGATSLLQLPPNVSSDRAGRHVSICRFRAPSCKSIIEILDGSYRGSRTPIDKICSPQAKQVRDQTGRILQQKTFLSTRNSMMVIFKRPSAPLSTNEAEFLTGAYYFHDGKSVFHIPAIVKIRCWY